MLTKETVQEILNHLQARPYAEVYQLIAKIVKEANAAEAPKAE